MATQQKQFNGYDPIHFFYTSSIEDTFDTDIYFMIDDAFEQVELDEFYESQSSSAHQEYTYHTNEYNSRYLQAA